MVNTMPNVNKVIDIYKWEATDDEDGTKKKKLAFKLKIA